jgi:L-alanine-DL-glutamate epimerase-like enolase superfamily enzyme
MNRRTYFKTLLAACAAPQLPALEPLPATNGKMKITAVEVWRLEGHRPPPDAARRQPTARPLDVYENLRPNRAASPPQGNTVPATAMYIKIKTDAGVEGFYGPVFPYVCTFVDQQLKSFLIGKDPLAGEAIWDQMYRNNPHSQGVYYMAMSAVDNTLWDLRGRYYNTPVYRLLGGPTRDRVECYASCIDLPVEPEPMSKLALQYKKEGFQHEKWFLAEGPGSGGEGLKKNVEMVRTLRETLGAEMEIMIDAWMSMDLNYAAEFAKRVEPYNLRWLEEPFLADEIQSFVELRKRTRVPIASGEHLYGRWSAAKYLSAGAIDILQTDSDWTGGVSELTKICAIASQYGVQVIPHGDCLHAMLHVIASQSPHVCPIMEYMVNRLNAGQWKYYFEKYALIPSEGKIALPDRPGFGIELDPARVERQTLVTVNWN